MIRRDHIAANQDRRNGRTPRCVVNIHEIILYRSRIRTLVHTHAGFKVALRRPILRYQMDEMTVAGSVCLSVEGVGIALLLFPVKCTATPTCNTGNCTHGSISPLY